jgi:uncharacterized delta-60 repeat protein
MRHSSVVAGVALVALFAGAKPSVAANPADLDPTFANNGSLTVTFAEGTSGAGAVVLQPDDKIVGAGNAGGDLALVRCDITGLLDPTFGTGGKVTTDFAGLTAGATGLALLPDGRLVAAGSSSGTGLVVARYLTDGTLDPTFGVGGRVHTSGHFGQAMVLQSDGMVVVGGFGAHGFMLSRFDEDGVPDPTFGTAGVASLDFPTSNGYVIEMGGLGLQPDGKLIAVGGGNTLIALARFATDGTLDPTFGTGGTTTTDVRVFGSEQLASSSAHAVIVQPDGKLAVAAATQNVGDSGDGFPITVGHALVLRYDDTGAIDTSFNTTGKVIVGGGGLFSGPVKARALVLQPDGKLVATGDGYFRKRINIDGTIDGTFTTTQTRNGSASGLVRQPDSRLVAAGASPTGGGTFEILRIGSTCGNLAVDPGETCDDGNVVNGDGCDNNCTPTGCGNHVVTAGESCDDGNAVLGDGCRPDCTAELCGDGIPDPQEQCDDGNVTSGDGCDANCTPTGCGNDIVTAGEDCEPGLGQCCTASCTFESLGTPCVGTPAACYLLECNGAGACTTYEHPDPTCVAAPTGNSQIALRTLTDAKKRSATWSWNRGPVTTADIPVPFTTTHQLCIYDHAAGVPHLVLAQSLANGCVACRKTTVKGWDYKQKSGTQGFLRWSLRASNGKGNFKLKAVGNLLGSTSSLPLTSDPRVTVQLRNQQGDCWGAEFTTVKKNDPGQYKAKSD